MSAPTPTKPAAGKPAAKPAGLTVAQLEKMLRAAVDNSLAQLRRIDPDAASDLDALRRREADGFRLVSTVPDLHNGDLVGVLLLFVAD